MLIIPSPANTTRCYNLLSRWFLRQGRWVAIVRQVAVWWPMRHGRPLGHGRLARDVRRPLRRRVGRQLVRHMRMLRSGRWRMVRREGVVRPLSHHVVSTRVAIWSLPHRRRTCLVPSVGKVRRRNLRASLLRSIAIVRARRRCHRGHAVARYKRLCLGVEGMTVEASRDGVLALRVIWIGVSRKSTIRVGYAWRARWRGSRLVRALIKSGRRRRWRRLLPTMLSWWRTLHRWHIRCRRHRVHWRLVPRWTWRLGVLLWFLSVKSQTA